MMVALDIDGVLADFISPFLRRLEKRVGNGPIDVDTITDLTFKSHPFLTEQIVSDCMIEVSNEPAFWRDLAPLPSRDQWMALEALSRDGRLVFLTHRYERDGYDISRVTGDWLRTHGISRPSVFFTQKEKSELVEKLKVQFFVDDRQENCQDVAENTRAIVLMPRRPYNRFFQHPRVRRIGNLDELFAQLG